MTDTQWALIYLNSSHLLLWVGVAMSLLGCGFSLYAITDAYRTKTALIDAHINSYRMEGALTVIRTHKLILTAQCVTAVAALAILTLPEVPVTMYAADNAGPWTLVVLTFRKLTLLAVTTVLLLLSLVWVRWLSTLPRTV